MVTEKLAKEFEKIRTSLAKSKKLILADIEKIDEKYRRLAQEEKKTLTENLGILNEQLKYYDNMLGGVSENAEDTSVEEQKSEEEPTIQDTIFPENNEPEEPEKQEEVKETKAVDLDAEEDAEWEKKIKSGEIKAVNTDAIVTEDASQPEQAENATVAVEDIPQLNDSNWGDPNNVKTGDDGWPQW